MYKKISVCRSAGLLLRAHTDWNGLIVRGLCSDIINGQVAAVPIENSLSLLAQPRASKLLHRLRSHSLRSEAALKVFFGYMPHLSLFCLNRYNKIIQLHSISMILQQLIWLHEKAEKGGGVADEACYCQPLYKRAALLRGSRWRQYGSLWLFYGAYPGASV